jgi:uncharacterized SAM-binding protein YcdF (DUF218 family)
VKRSSHPLGILAGIAFLIVVFTLYGASTKLLLFHDTVQPAGAIVLLGGESGERVFEAAEAYSRKLAPLIIVSGKGDCRKNHARLRLSGVPEDSIINECRSASTAENADFTSRILKNKGINKAIIVTSWWHTRRAVRSFIHYAPEIEFSAVPAHNGEKVSPSLDQFVSIMLEYSKTAWYFFGYHI